MRIFKYKSVRGESLRHVETIIKENSLFFAPVEAFNDPFEFSYTANFSTTVEEFEAYTNRNKAFANQEILQMIAQGKTQDLLDNPEFENVYRDVFSTLIETVRKFVGVQCFSENIADINLWSFYGDHHTGVCFEFETSEDESILGKNHEVTYVDTPVHFDFFLDTPESGKEKTKKMLLTKYSQAFDKEKERRILTDTVCSKRFSKKALKAIYFGLRFDFSKNSHLISLIREHYPDADLYRMKKGVNYELISVKVIKQTIAGTSIF